MLIRLQSPIRSTLSGLMVAVVGLVFVGFGSGCQTAPPYTGFETEAELEAQLSRTEMLHRYARVEMKGGGIFPFDTDMEPGGGFGLKGSLEAYKNIYFGLEYGYFQQNVDETIEDFQDVFNSDPARGEALALRADAEQWLKSLDRHNFLITADYYVPLGDAWGLNTPIFRSGLGLGAAIIVGEEVSTGTLAADVDARTFAGLLARPSMGIYLPVLENLELFAEGSLDVVFGNELTIDGDLVGRRTKIEDRVNFSAVSLLGGVTFTW